MAPLRRVGLLGFGSIAENGHLPAWQSFPGVEVIAVADLSTARLQRAAELLPEAQLFEAPLDLIAHAEIDILDICTPPGTHIELIEAACDRGIPDIVSEKPLVLSEEEYQRAERARARSGSRILSINNWLHSDLYRYVHQVLEEGTVGDVRSILLRTERPDCAMGNAGWMPRWRTDLAHAGGGIVLDHGWHQLYLLLGWIGENPIDIHAITRTVDPRHAPVEDQAVIDLTFPSASGRIELSWIGDGRRNDGLIECTRGRIIIHDDRIEVETAQGSREMRFAGRLTESSYHPDWFREVFAGLIVDNESSTSDNDIVQAAGRTFAEAGVLVRIISAVYSAGRNGAARHPAGVGDMVPGTDPGEGIGLSHVGGSHSGH